MSQVSPRVRRVCFERDREACARCPGGRPAAQLHHRRPRGMGSSSRGSTNEPSNLVCLCEPCHREIESHREQAIAEGYIVPQSQEPSTVPLLSRGQWVLLDDNGGRKLCP